MEGRPTLCELARPFFNSAKPFCGLGPELKSYTKASRMAAAVLARPSTSEPGLDNRTRIDLCSPKPSFWSGMATASSSPAPSPDRRTPSTPDKRQELEPFTFDDPIHGPWRIESLCILALLAHPSFRRLQHVLQHGITALMKLTPEPPETRWEHSIGAMIAVGKAGGSEEAMISALLRERPPAAADPRSPD